MEAATTMQCRDWTRGAGTAHEHCPSLSILFASLLFPRPLTSLSGSARRRRRGTEASQVSSGLRLLHVHKVCCQRERHLSPLFIFGGRRKHLFGVSGDAGARHVQDSATGMPARIHLLLPGRRELQPAIRSTSSRPRRTPMSIQQQCLYTRHRGWRFSCADTAVPRQRRCAAEQE